MVWRVSTCGSQDSLGDGARPMMVNTKQTSLPHVHRTCCFKSFVWNISLVSPELAGAVLSHFVSGGRVNPKAFTKICHSALFLNVGYQLDLFF